MQVIVLGFAGRGHRRTVCEGMQDTCRRTAEVTDGGVYDGRSTKKGTQEGSRAKGSRRNQRS